MDQLTFEKTSEDISPDYISYFVHYYYYNSLNLLKEIRDPRGFNIDYTYDDAGRITSVTNYY